MRLIVSLLLLVAAAGLALKVWAQEPTTPTLETTPAERPVTATAADALTTGLTQLSEQVVGSLPQPIQAAWGRDLISLGAGAVTVGSLILAAIMFVLILLVVLVVRWVIERKLQRQRDSEVEQKDEDSKRKFELGLSVIRGTHKWVIFVVALYLALLMLPFHSAVNDLLDKIVIVVLVFQAGIWASTLLVNWLEQIKEQRRERDPSSVAAFGLFQLMGKVLIWSVGLLFLLNNLGFNITSLVAGLGIGGIAIAFALQAILGDLFCSVAIILDKPFVVGDFIIVGDMLGVVEHIGLKTTRLRSLSGEQIVFSNTDIIGSRVRNYKRMYERRVAFSIGVIYQTPPEKLLKIQQMAREIIEGLENTRFDRAHFKEYGPYSLNFEIVYYVLGPDYTLYMDIQQAINLALYNGFKEEGIEFAYPTQELLLRQLNQDKEPVGQTE